ncbi:uncharacterized protein RSE6_01178 [Rhynchosporium secalis]|uniref:Uncharacterized protein n=1 Tax=Rhynchosporium secalis TaxID=38038 RepID=A0A1E1LX50_RHYSE|nr:uncharacterized protein RSE6_01178 [Rhynchosporium secalis]
MASLAVFVLKSIIKREIPWTSVLLKDEDSHIAISALSLTTKRRKRKEKIPRGSSQHEIQDVELKRRSEERKEHWNHDELMPATATIKPPSPVPFSSDIHFPMISTRDM